jgi:hypothetical protein
MPLTFIRSCRRLTAPTAQLVSQLGKLLLLKKQFFARCKPFTLSDDLVVLNPCAEWYSHILQFKTAAATKLKTYRYSRGLASIEACPSACAAAAHVMRS